MIINFLVLLFQVKLPDLNRVQELDFIRMNNFSDYVDRRICQYISVFTNWSRPEE
jgi:hypothetical protein